MSRNSAKTVALFVGLPYSGKTALIERLLEVLPGEAIYVDQIFREIVPEDEICLERWLNEGARFIDRMVELADRSTERMIFVELGIMQRSHRTELTRRFAKRAFRIIPVLLECRSSEELRDRQHERQSALFERGDKRKISIGIDELLGPIRNAFEEPDDDENYSFVDTSLPIDDCVAQLERIFANEQL